MMTTHTPTEVLVAILLVAVGYCLRGLIDALRHALAHRLPGHATVSVGGIEVDTELAPLVTWAQQNGVVTTCSCQNVEGFAYLKLRDFSDALRLFQTVSELPGIRSYSLEAEEPCTHPGDDAPDHDTEYVVAWDATFTPSLAASLTPVR